MNWRNVWVLSLSQAAGLSGLSAIVLLGGIIGIELAPTPALATLPISLSVVGVAITSIPAALFMKRFGRRTGFVASAALASLGGLLTAYAVSQSNFWLFCLGISLIGMNSAFMQQYRFAASESVAEAHVSRAVSLVLLGG
ncbi:MAG TPA: MFS transporter, partial [Anaerolineaceae bacterium]|nr:MFS transporter [Anaerolineaceae bacterium]